MALTRRKQQGVYYQGWINIKLSDAVDYHRCYAVLRGFTLCLCANQDAANTVEKEISLEGVEGLRKDMSARAITKKSTFPTISMQFRSLHGSPQCEIRIRASKNEEQEEWYRYLMATAMSCYVADNISAKNVYNKALIAPNQTVWQDDMRESLLTTHKLPENKHNLLPGQVKCFEDIINEVHQLLEAKHCYMPMNGTKLNASKGPIPAPKPARRISVPEQRPVAPVRPDDVRQRLRKTSTIVPPSDSGAPTPQEDPKWYFANKMGRGEAEELLKSSEEHGNMLMRVRDVDDQWDYAVSVKIPDEANSYKHYRVRKKIGGGQLEYEIFLGDKGHSRLFSMEEVMQYFVKESSGKFVPLKQVIQCPYHEYDDVVKVNSSFVAKEKPGGNQISYENFIGTTTREEHYINSHPTASRPFSQGGRPQHLPRHASFPVIPFPANQNGTIPMLEEEPDYL